MVRESLAAGAAHASVFVTPGNGVVFQRRLQAAGATSYNRGPQAVAPGWVKLARRGDVITASASSDGASWTVLGSEVVVMPSTFYVGLALTSHDEGTLAYASFDQLAVTAVPRANAGALE